MISKVKKFVRTVVLAASVYSFATSGALAATNLSCTFKVNDVAVVGWGVLFVPTPMGILAMCNLNGTIHVTDGSGGGWDITPAVCQAWVAKFLTAKTTQQNINLITSFATAPSGCVPGIFGSDYSVPNPFPFWVDLTQ